MKFGPIVRFAPLLIVLASGVSGLRPRRSLLPDGDHGFLRRGDGGPDQSGTTTLLVQSTTAVLRLLPTELP